MGIGPRITEDSSSQASEKKQVTFQFEMLSPRFSRENIVLSSDTESALLDFLALKSQYDKVFNFWGLAETHGHQKQNSVNFYGPPGTGKTMAAHVIAKEMGKKLIPVSYAELESKYVGETSKNITSLFETAKNNDAIIFFDEADAILSRRVTNMSHATDVSVNQTRSVLLTLMDDHDGLIIFTTNFIENYDPAFMRRILSHIKFSLPDHAARERIWRMYLPSAMPTQVNMDSLIEMSEGLSGAEISRAVVKAALSAARLGLDCVSSNFFFTAVSEIKEAKVANSQRGQSVKLERQDRHVDHEYVKEKLGEEKMKEIMG